MLRYFYLLYLLICIEWAICYDYKNLKGNNNYRYADRRIRKGINRSGNLKHRREYKLHDEIFDVKNPVAQFDVSSFIQNSAEDIYQEDNKQRISKDNGYGSYIGINVNDNNRKKDKSTDFSLGTDNAPENINPPLFKDTNLNGLSLDDVSTRKYMHERENKVPKGNYQHDFYVERNNIHKPEKKCSFKNLQFPFFSHTKPEVKNKKEKKRKIICKKCSKKVESNDIPQSNERNLDTTRYKFNKRSYEEMLCPKCRRRFITNDRLKHSAKGMIHNSRQFYQNIKDLAKHRSRDSTNSPDIENNKDDFEAVTHLRNDRRSRRTTVVKDPSDWLCKD